MTESIKAFQLKEDGEEINLAIANTCSWQIKDQTPEGSEGYLQ